MWISNTGTFFKAEMIILHNSDTADNLRVVSAIQT